MFKKVDGFIIGLIAMIALAWIHPGIGNEWGAFSLSHLTDIGISIIFFFYGLKLSPKQVMAGLSNYKLHIVVQLSTFLLFPLLVILALPFVQSTEAKILWLSIFFLAALPSTVSSSVVMVVLAKGNTAGAIFNASISGLLGILITPLWMSLFLNTSGHGFDFSDTLIRLLIKIFLPIIAGLLLHRHFGHMAKQNLKWLALFDKGIILAIVYHSFSQSFNNGLFASIRPSHLLILGICVILLFVVAYLIIYFASDFLKLNREDKITATFCGSKKSLVHGTVMSNVLFNGMASLGLFLMPIMIYHTMQLVVISFIAQRYRKEHAFY